MISGYHPPRVLKGLILFSVWHSVKNRIYVKRVRALRISIIAYSGIGSFAALRYFVLRISYCFPSAKHPPSLKLRRASRATANSGQAPLSGCHPPRVLKGLILFSVWHSVKNRIYVKRVRALRISIIAYSGIGSFDALRYFVLRISYCVPSAKHPLSLKLRRAGRAGFAQWLSPVDVPLSVVPDSLNP